MIGTPSHRLAVLGLGVMLAYCPAIFSAPSMPRWWLIAIGVPLLGAFHLARGDWRILGLACAGLAYASFHVIVWPQDGLLPFYMLCLIVLTAVAASAAEKGDMVLSAIGWGVAVSSVICLADELGWALFTKGGSPYPGGLFYNSEIMAEIAAPLFIWALVSKRWWLAFFLVSPLVLCHSRISIIAVGIGIAYAMTRGRWRVLSCMVVPAVIGIALVLLWPEKLSSLGHRVTMWIAAIWSITPLGNGLGWWASAHPFPFEEFVHSDALQFLVELGIGGLFFLAIPVIIFIRGIADTAKGACFAGLCFEALVSFPLHVPATAFLFAVVTGLICRDRALVRVEKLDGGIDRGPYLRWSTTYR